MVARRPQWGILLAATVFRLAVFVCQAITPYLLGRAIDDGLSDGVGSRLLTWVAIMEIGRAHV